MKKKKKKKKHFLSYGKRIFAVLIIFWSYQFFRLVNIKYITCHNVMLAFFLQCIAFFSKLSSPDCLSFAALFKLFGIVYNLKFFFFSASMVNLLASFWYSMISSFNDFMSIFNDNSSSSKSSIFFDCSVFFLHCLCFSR